MNFFFSCPLISTFNIFEFQVHLYNIFKQGQELKIDHCSLCLHLERFWPVQKLQPVCGEAADNVESTGIQKAITQLLAWIAL